MRIDGGEVECRWWGNDNAINLPVVLLHEGLGSVGLWRDFPARLAEATGRRVFAYSRFGHGASDRPLMPRTTQFMHDEARLLPRILDAAAIQRAVLVGHSDGGSIALIAAAEFPARIEALILEAPHVFVEDVGIASIERTTSAFRDGSLRSLLSRHHQNVDAAFHGWSDVWLDPEFRRWNLEHYLARITCPTLLIQGDADEYGTLAQLEAIERQVAGPVERLLLPRCGHSPHRDRPDIVLGAMAAFARRLD